MRAPSEGSQAIAREQVPDAGCQTLAPTRTLRRHPVNGGTTAAELTLLDHHSNISFSRLLPPGGKLAHDLPTGVTMPTDKRFGRRFAGHIGNGEASITDPAIGF